MKTKKALLVISFGTSYEETRKKTIERIEEDLKNTFPDRTFFRAWTSGVIRRKIKDRDGLVIPSVEEALEEIEKAGITDLLIQPTHIQAGGEYAGIMQAVRLYENTGMKIRIGRPLLDTEEDIKEMAGILTGLFSGAEKADMTVFMGHGSEKAALPVYKLLGEAFEQTGHGDFVVGTVEFDPGIGIVLDKVREQKPERVVLTPFLIVAGDHALNDMSGDEEDSWKNRIAAEGPEVDCIVKGMGEYPQIRALFVRKAKEAL